MIKELWTGFKTLLFPPTCLLCHLPLVTTEYRHFCAACFAGFIRLDPSSRCIRCFQLECHCHAHPRLTRRTLAVFEYDHNAESLVQAFKFGGRSYLAEGMGALMALQWLEADLPLPDMIVPVPSSPLATYKRGYSPSLLLATTLGHLMHRPVWNGLKKELTFLKQSQLSETERHHLSPDHILFKKSPAPLFDKHLLLVDDVLTTGQTLHQSASRLLEGYPKCMDALVFAI